MGIEISGVAFYGCSLKANRKEALYSRLVNWFSSHGISPNHAGASGRGCSNKMQDFSVLDKKLRKSRLEGVVGFEIYYVPPKGVGKKYPWIEAHFTERDHGQLRLLCKSEISRVPSAEYLKLVREIAQIVECEYGIGLRQDLALAPSGYMTGFTPDVDDLSPEEEEELMSIARWGDIGIAEERVYRKGELRDVYPWNFLTKAQLNAPVEKITLEEWIRCNPQFGQLVRVSDKMLLWEANELRIADARQMLSKSGRIFDYRKYIEDERLSGDELLGQVLKLMGHDDPSTAIVLDGAGNEIPTEEVRKRVKKKGTPSTRKTRKD